MCSEANGRIGSAPALAIQPVSVSSAASAASLAPSPGLRPCRILLVEDHADTALMMQRLLARRGYVVTLAMTLADALEAVQSRTFDLLLSDVGLPDGSGLDLMRTLSSRSPKLPGVALSGYGMPDDARRSLDAGFFAHLAKPVAIERLWATIDRVLASCAAPTEV